MAISLGHVALLGSLTLLKYFKVCGHLVVACHPIGIFDPFEVLQGLWPSRWGVSPYWGLWPFWSTSRHVAISLGRVALLGSLTLLKYFKAYCHLIGACLPIGIFDPFEVLQGLWPSCRCISPKLGSLILANAFFNCNCRMYATEISKFDKFSFLFTMWLGYQTWDLIKTFKWKPSLGIKPKLKEYPLQKLYMKTWNTTLAGT
jgi:hypothetical protein